MIGSTRRQSGCVRSSTTTSVPSRPAPLPGARASELDADTRDYLVKVGNLKGMLNDRARNGSPSEQEYAKLRAELIAIPPIRDALPNFVLRHQTIEEF